MKTYTFGAATILLALISIDSARADAVLGWNIVMQTTVGTQSPFAQARLAAVAAAHGVLKNYFPGNAAVLDAARAS